MRNLGFLLYGAVRAWDNWMEGRKTIHQRINQLRKSGYTKTVFDYDGHTVVIQSHKHINDDRA